MPKKNKKQLIVNADDFGLTEGINRGIIHCFKNGIVRSASLMANGGAFDHAVSLIRENRGLGLGWHVILVGESPVASPDKIKSLMDKDGKLLKDYKYFIFKYVTGGINLNEVIHELESQVVKILDSGINIDHIDSHQYIHMLPHILSIVIKLAKKYNIPYLRYPRRELFQAFNVKGIGLFLFAAVSCSKVNDSGLRYGERCFGYKKSCRMDESNLLEYIDACLEGVSEIICHPGFIDETYRRSYSYWGNRPEQELSALISSAVKQRIELLGIELVNYSTLYQNHIKNE